MLIGSLRLAAGLRSQTFQRRFFSTVGFHIDVTRTSAEGGGRRGVDDACAFIDFTRRLLSTVLLNTFFSDDN